ncbi:MAG: LysM domain-containing protein [Pseudomonadota bacterium]
MANQTNEKKYATKLRTVMFLGLMLLIWAIPSAISAQEEQTEPGRVSPAERMLPTGRPTSPTDFPTELPRLSAEEPGASEEDASAEPAKAEGEAAAADGYSGGDLIISDRKRHEIPEYHGVKEGDTLWDICKKYYNDSWAWPQLWAYNKTITNPHWIYPGDRIRLLGHDPNVEKSSGRFLSVASPNTKKFETGQIKLRQDGFIGAKELEESGRIVGSKIERILLAAHDEVYVKGEGKFLPRVGQLMTIYRVDKELVNSEGDLLGHVVEILGTARIKRTEKDKAATAEIVESLNPIIRGSRLGPLRRLFRQLDVKPATKDLDARIIATLWGGKHIGTNVLVFVDRGTNQGVSNGNRFLVMRRGDGYRRLAHDVEKDNPEFPYETIAEVSVLDAQEEASVGLVTRAVKEVREGDYMKMRRGY